MIHQLRNYEIFEHNKKAFHDRFREHAMRIMRKYDFEIISIWETRPGERTDGVRTDGVRTEFVYLLAWPDEETMRKAWARFREDGEWKEIKRITGEQHGDLVGEIEERVLLPASYSPGRI